MADTDYIPVMVCSNHDQFVPCNGWLGGGDCYYTSDPLTVDSIRAQLAAQNAVTLPNSTGGPNVTNVA